MMKEKLLLLLAMLLSVTSVYANVIVNATRVIFNSDSKEYSLKINNENPYPVLVQSWVDDGNFNISSDIPNTPFTILPPMFRMDAGQGQTLRILYDGDNLPNDRESIYWVNVFEIPPKEKSTANHLQLAFRSRIKLFFRPSQLKAPITDELAKNIHCSINSALLSCENKTAYYISFSSVDLISGAKREPLPLDSFGMIPPYGIIKTKLSAGNTQDHKLNFKIINDQGGVTDYTLEVSNG